MPSASPQTVGRPAQTQTRCHLCGQAVVSELDGYRQFARVSSDCRPQPAGGRLGVCAVCSLLQTMVDGQWQREVDQIYRDYDIYHQTGGREQVVFDCDRPTGSPRSQRLIERLRQHVPLPDRGRALDIGAGNGAFLRAFSDAMPGWSLAGSELSDRYRPVVESITQVEAFHTCPPADVPGRFDLISMIHVLEHVPGPQQFLRGLRDKLTPTGLLLVQLPYFQHNPFELLIADHCAHFTVRTLARTLRQAGFDPVHIATDWIVKELSAVAGLAGQRTTAVRQPDVDADATMHAAQESLLWLASVRDLALKLSDRGRIGVFGSSIAGAWLAGELGNRLSFFVDEDTDRTGAIYMARPIVQPHDVGENSDVLIALPTPLAETIYRRVARPGVRYHLPPPLPATSEIAL